MNKFLLTVLILLAVGCSPVKQSVTAQYGLLSYSVKHAYKKTQFSILISPPEAVTGFSTEQMRYTIKPYELSSFAHNAWYSPPADMLLALMVKSLQQSGYFKGVASTYNSDPTDYRIDTQLIDLKQNFIKNPIQMDFTVKVVLTHVPDNRVLASRIMDYHINCKEKTPFAGVIAANEATKRFTAELTDFIMLHLMN